MLCEMLAQDAAMPVSNLLSGGIAAAVATASLAFAKIVATHFKDREKQQYDAMVAREKLLTEKIDRIDGVQREALMQLALSSASQTATLAKIIEQNTTTHQQLIEAFHDWSHVRMRAENESGDVA